jgi:hypothetical protein
LKSTAKPPKPDFCAERQNTAERPFFMSFYMRFRPVNQ